MISQKRKALHESFGNSPSDCSFGRDSSQRVGRLLNRRNKIRVDLFRKEKRQIKQLRSELSTLNIDLPDSDCFRAVMFLVYLNTTNLPLWKVARNLKYDQSELEFFISNWTKYNCYKNGVVLMEDHANEMEMIINLTLMGMMGIGMIGAQQIDVDSMPKLYAFKIKQSKDGGSVSNYFEIKALSLTAAWVELFDKLKDQLGLSSVTEIKFHSVKR